MREKVPTAGFDEEIGPAPAPGAGARLRGGTRTERQRRSGMAGGLFVLLPLGVGLVALFVISWQWRSSLKIEHILVEGADIVGSARIADLAGVPANTPMYGVNLLDVQRRVLGQPFLKSATVTRRLPDALRIEVVEREPVAAVNAGSLLYVDAEGVLLPCAAAERRFDLPLICGIALPELSRAGTSAASRELSEALEVCQTARSIDSTVYRMISEVNMSGGGEIVLYSSEAGVPIILGRGDIARKLITLESFWNNFVHSPDAQKLRYIDLRFEDQVVVRWNQEGDGGLKKISFGAFEGLHHGT